MNPAHAHLVLNHIPVLGAAFALLLLAYGALRKSDEIIKLTLGVLVLVALSAIPVYLTGEPAEERVEHAPGVTHDVIEEHEESALAALIAVEVTGVLGLVGLVIVAKTKSIPQWLTLALLVVLLVTNAILFRTANLGGQIRHTEIRSDAAGASTISSERDDH